MWSGDRQRLGVSATATRPLCRGIPSRVIWEGEQKSQAHSLAVPGSGERGTHLPDQKAVSWNVLPGKIILNVEEIPSSHSPSPKSG